MKSKKSTGLFMPKVYSRAPNGGEKVLSILASDVQEELGHRPNYIFVEMCALKTLEGKQLKAPLHMASCAYHLINRNGHYYPNGGLKVPEGYPFEEKNPLIKNFYGVRIRSCGEKFEDLGTPTTVYEQPEFGRMRPVYIMLKLPK